MTIPNTQWPWRDGVGCEYYNGKLKMFGGWNPAAFSPNVSTNEQWESTNLINWTQLSNAPWTPRHVFGHTRMLGKIWLWGGDPYFDGIMPKDIWTFDDVNGWVRITDDWGDVGGTRMFFAYCSHKNQLYMAGGQSDPGPSPTVYTDVLKWNGSVWVTVGTIPMTCCSTSSMFSDGTNLYLMGGGQYTPSGPININDKLYKSSDDGATWTLVSTLPRQGLAFCSGATSNGYIIFVNGANAMNVNRSSMWYLKIGSSGPWSKIYDIPFPSHGRGICKDDSDNIYTVSGNATNEILKITKQIM